MKSRSPTLKCAFLALQKEVQDFREEILKEKEHRVLGALIRRGLRCYPKEQEQSLLLPAGKRSREKFYSHLKEYSFRLFLRDVIKNKDSFSLEDLLRYCSQTSAEEYLRFLVRVGVVLPMRQSRFMLKHTRISSFGETLEWFVCQILEKEFYLPSLWGFRVKENLMTLAAFTEIPIRESPAIGFVSVPFNLVDCYLLNVQQNDFKKVIAPRIKSEFRDWNSFSALSILCGAVRFRPDVS